MCLFPSFYGILLCFRESLLGSRVGFLYVLQTLFGELCLLLCFLRIVTSLLRAFVGVGAGSSLLLSISLCQLRILLRQPGLFVSLSCIALGFVGFGEGERGETDKQRDNRSRPRSCSRHAFAVRFLLPSQFGVRHVGCDPLRIEHGRVDAVAYLQQTVFHFRHAAQL